MCGSRVARFRSSAIRYPSIGRPWPGPCGGHAHCHHSLRRRRPDWPVRHQLRALTFMVCATAAIESARRRTHIVRRCCAPPGGVAVACSSCILRVPPKALADAGNDGLARIQTMLPLALHSRVATTRARRRSMPTVAPTPTADVAAHAIDDSGIRRVCRIGFDRCCKALAQIDGACHHGQSRTLDPDRAAEGAG